MASADPLAITRAILEGALHKANDAVYADGQHDWEYAMQSYADSCALLGRCMERTDQRDEEGALHWRIMEGIVRCPSSLLCSLNSQPPKGVLSIRIHSRLIHCLQRNSYIRRIHDIHNTYYPPTPRSRSRNSRSGGVDSKRSSTWANTPPRTPSRVQTPPRTPKLGPPHPMPGAVEMRDRYVSVWSRD